MFKYFLKSILKQSKSCILHVLDKRLEHVKNKLITNWQQKRIQICRGKNGQNMWMIVASIKGKWKQKNEYPISLLVKNI